MNSIHLLLTGVLATASTFLAAESTFSASTPVNFGRVLGLTHSDCTFNIGGTGLSGMACLDSTGTLGDITISATANQTYTVTLFPPAGPSNQISYQPLLVNGSPSATVSADADGRFTLQIGGFLSTGGATPTAGNPTDFIYTIQVDSN